MKHRVQICFWLIFSIILFTGIYLVKDILLPFIAGIAVAYFLDPLLDKIEKFGLSRLLATVLITLGFFISIVGFLLIVGPLIQTQVIEFAQKLPGILNALTTWLLPFQEKLQEGIFAGKSVELDQIGQSFGGLLVEWVIAFSQSLFDGGVAVFNLISMIIITPIVCFYLLRDWDRAIEKIDSWLPNDYSDGIRLFCSRIDLTIASFVRGQLVVCIILAFFYGTGLTLLGLEFGLVIGGITGLISFIPYFGTLLGFLASLIVAFYQFGDLYTIILVVVLFGIGQGFESAVLTPKLVGSAVGLHSLWVIFALMAGGTLFGFVGVLLAIPVAAVIGVLGRLLLDYYLSSEVYIGRGSNPSSKDSES